MKKKFDNKIEQELNAFIEQIDQGEIPENFDELYEKFSDFLPSFPKCDAKKTLMKHLLSEKQLDSTVLSDTFVDILQKELWWILDGEDSFVRRALLCFVVWKKLHPHPSGWIKYVPNEIMKPLFTPKEIEEIIKKPCVIQKCCNRGMDMMVIGSKHPIVCYSLPELLGDDTIILSFPYSDLKKISDSLDAFEEEFDSHNE